MKTVDFLKRLAGIIFCLLLVTAGSITMVNAQSFSQNGINFNNKGSVSAGTGLKFGPDGRLYVTEYSGKIKIFTIERNGPGNYTVLNMEVLSHIQQIQNYNDDGTKYTATSRETIGITVVGTSSKPVIYVSSSDFRIGGGGGGGSGDKGLDTNSGIITRFNWTGSAWEVVDIVRGLPRSEENHATNGLEFVSINGIDYLIVAQGGHTNAGAPSKNFAYTTEYALSAAVLSINLTMLEAMPILDDNGRKYIYDLPTMDDPSRPNKNGIINPDAPGYDGIDVNDPFGGNDGLNQAIIVPGGPVQIFSPGYRNAYDLVVTQKGAVYITDNGANGGWGGFPVNEGGGNANNDYDPNEPGSSISSGGEQINNKDHLSLITTNIQTYSFGSFYGGHPTPVRANPHGAGLYTNPAVTGTEGAIFRTKIYHPTKSSDGYTTDPKLGLPANWPPVKTANPVEGDYRGPGEQNPDGPVDQLVTIWGTNTNGIDEYKASNFNNAMKGNLIAGVNTGELRRVELNDNGSLKKLTPSFVSGLGGNALGIACNGDDEIFPGTIWVVTLNGHLIVLEPQDFTICLKPGDTGYDPLADNDKDGYTNQDELDNGTDPCNGGSQPGDHDKAAGGVLISDRNDLDDDNDAVMDSEDPFQLGDPLKDGSDAFDLPVINELFSSNNLLQGYLGLGMTGLMNNKAPNPNWLNWLDRRDDPNEPNPNDILGGAIGAMTMQMTAGTAYGTKNNQEKGFQYGVKLNEASGIITVAGGLFNFNDPLQLYGHPQAPNAELGIFIGDGFQSNYIKFVLTKNGLTVLQEVNDIPQNPLTLDIPVANRPMLGAALYFIINPSSGIITMEYAFDSGVRKPMGSLIAQGSVLEAIRSQNKDLAVGLIGTSNAAGVEVEGTWDYLNVTTGAPYITQKLPDLEKQIGSMGEEIDLINYFSDESGVENLVFTVVENSNKEVGTVINKSILTLNFSNTPAVSHITIRATNRNTKFVEQTFKVILFDAPTILYRVNAGGPAILSIDGGMNWDADTATEISPYLSEPGRNKTYSGFMNSYTEDVDLVTTPVSIFNTERYDSSAGAPNMTYSFPVTLPGKYEVRLYLGNSHVNTSLPGSRIFNVEIENILYPNLENLDLAATFGQKIGAVIKHSVNVNDGVINITFFHVKENPLINGIEILAATIEENPIQVVQIPNQVNIVGDVLDESLVVKATGGDGYLKYSMTGQPAGVTIEPTTGQIGGAIGADANLLSPYNVTVVVDDSDEKSDDAVKRNFTWTVTAGEPVIVKVLPNFNEIVGASNKALDLNDYFNDINGNNDLTYSVSQNTNPAIATSLNGSILNIAFPQIPAISNITIRATGSNKKYVEQTFKIIVTADSPSLVLYRVNSGGPAIAAIDGKIAWGADTSTENSPYLSEPGRNKTYYGSMNSYTGDVDLSTTPVSIFNTERYDSSSGAPNMTYSFPVNEPGFYEVRLYMGNGHINTSLPGTRIFDVQIEGIIYPNLDNLDLAATFGHKVGAVVTHKVEVLDGILNVTFIHVVENPLINGIEILGSSGDANAIQIAKISNQSNLAGDVLNGTLKATATGGEGALVFSISGAPAGVVINSSNGVISGTIGLNTVSGSPFNVTVKVDDSDGDSNDAVSTHFTWTIFDGTPFIVQKIPDLERSAGSANEEINLNSYFDDNDGVENLTYTVQGNTNLVIGAVVSGNKLLLNFPSEPANSTIIIRATDISKKYVEQTFKIIVTENSPSLVLYRVNSGGPAIAAIDGKIAWGADTSTEISPYLSEPGRNKTYSGSVKSYTENVNLTTTPVSIFNTERYDSSSGAPNMTYSFPLNEPGFYEVRLYMGNGHINTSLPGARIFDVQIEGIIYPNLDNLDLSATFGHQVGAVVTHKVEVLDGILNVTFIHVVENPLINGIEILGSSGDTNVIQIAKIPDQSNLVGDVLNGTLKATATGGDGALMYSISGAPAGVVINSSTGIISGTIGLNAFSGSPFHVTVTVDDSDGETSDAVRTQFMWTITDGMELWVNKDENENYTARHECSFVQAGDKFYLLGGREKAKTVDIYDYKSNSWVSLVDSAPFEFNHFQAVEYQGLIWVIGAFKDNAYPRETPAEHIYIFDPAGKEWIQGPEIPTGRRRGSTGLVIHNDVFYIMGGNTTGHDGGYVAWFDKYDPKTGIWTPLANAPRARDHFHTTVIGNKMYAAGGRLSGGTGGVFKPVIAEVDVYDFNTATWTTLPTTSNLPTPRAAASVVNNNGKLLVIGGEVETEPVYGTTTTDALRITEEFDPITGKWRRASDLNFKRHGTQVIKSGDGIFTLAGSPSKGGGSQKNMEFLGKDAPVGTASIASVVSVPETISLTPGVSSNIEVKLHTGNVAIFVTSITLSGLDATSFAVSSGNLSNSLIKLSNSHTITVDMVGSPTQSKTATLNINYGKAGKATVILKYDVANNIVLSPIANQSNNEGAVLNGSLKATATGGDGALVYKISGAPAGVVINSSTGLISGTIGSNTASGSPYLVTVTVDDSDAVSSDAVTTQFSWTILGTSTQKPIAVTQIPNQSNYSGDVLNGSLVINATGGDGALKYSISNAPAGVVINAANGIISGTISQEAHLLSPYNVSVTVDDSDVFTNDAVTVNFNWKVDQVQVAYQGCTAEFWAGSSGWCSTYKPTDSFFTVFGITNKRGLGGKNGILSLSDALAQKGGGYSKLAKQATAALLNACSPTVNFQYLETQVKAEVKDAFNNNVYNNSYANTLSSTYETANNAGCPSGQKSALASNSYEVTVKEADTPLFEDEPEVEETIIIKMYPNPANAEVYLKTPKPSVEITTVAMYDYNGRFIRTFSTGRELFYEGNESYMFNISGMPNGVYILKISTESSGVYTLRLVKED